MWTATVDSITKNVDPQTFTLVYTVTDGLNPKQVTEPRVSRADSIIQIMQNAVNYLNGVDQQVADIAKLDPTKFEGQTLDQLKAAGVIPLTQDQIDLAAFQSAMANYLTIYNTFTNAQLAKTATKLTQQDVLDAYSAWKATYIHEEYGALIPKDFPYQ